MDDESALRRPISLLRYEDDHALVERGSLIPLSVVKPPVVTLTNRPRQSLLVLTAVVALLVCGVLGGLVVTSERSVAFFDSLTQTATPAVMFKNSYSERAIAPSYGPQAAYSNSAFYQDTRDQLIAGAASFIDLNLVEGSVRYFNRGVLEVSGAVAHKAGIDSWCRTPAGLYQVDELIENHYSSYVDGNFPYSVVFGSNLFIHGVPTQTDGAMVADDFDRDCVRLSPVTAAKLFSAVAVGVPVLVHEVVEERETVSYESRVPNFSTPHYLIADLQNETIVAVGKRYEAVPIASLTKLMTALVVLEELSLDDRLDVGETNLVESLIPRLKDRSQVTVHTLLELLLIESSNEAAEVLAGAIGREKFIQRMNERAAELGLVDTVFTDPSGLDDGNVSSVNDLWWLTRYVYLHYPFIFTVTRNEAPLPKYVNDSYTDLVNFNTVESVDSFIGGKVGETTAAGQTSITLHRIMIGGEERDIAIVLLGSSGRRADVLRLLRYITERFES